MVKKRTSSGKKFNRVHRHVEGDFCYECGYGMKNVNWKCIIIAIIIGVAFGIYLAGGTLTQGDILKYLTIIMVAITLGLLLDVRKIILNQFFKN